MGYRAVWIVGIALALAVGCAPAMPASVPAESAAVSIASLGEAGARAMAPVAQASPTAAMQFPPPAPNQTPNNVVAPSPSDERQGPSAATVSPSAPQVASGAESIIQAVNPSIAGSAAGLLAYVADRAANGVAVVDLAGNSVVTTIPVGGAPSEMTVTGDGSRVYVAN